MNEYESLIRALAEAERQEELERLILKARELLSRLGSGPIVLRIYEVIE